LEARLSLSIFNFCKSRNYAIAVTTRKRRGRRRSLPTCDVPPGALWAGDDSRSNSVHCISFKTKPERGEGGLMRGKERWGVVVRRRHVVVDAPRTSVTLLLSPPRPQFPPFPCGVVLDLLHEPRILSFARAPHWSHATAPSSRGPGWRGRPGLEGVCGAGHFFGRRRGPFRLRNPAGFRCRGRKRTSSSLPPSELSCRGVSVVEARPRFIA
jgi:hypothetical protein